MKLSAKGHYGMHAMMDLAARYGQGAVLLRELCRPRGFSEKYVEQLLRSLRQAGLIESVRGARGGYWLARPPEEIAVIEIIEALEGELHSPPSGCRSDCAKRDHCAMLELWDQSSEAARRSLMQTLADLLRRQDEMDQSESPHDFSI